MSEILNKLNDILDKLNRKDALKILGEILSDYDLTTASNLVKADCEPYLTKMCLEDNFYSEGNEEAGFIFLKDILKSVEEVLNCDDYISNSVTFTHFVRQETPEESEEKEHHNGIEWYIKDESINIDTLKIQFET